MAFCDWTRPPVETPPATFTLLLSEEEAVAVLAVLNGDGDVADLRCAYSAQYEVSDALAAALASASGRLG